MDKVSENLKLLIEIALKRKQIKAETSLMMQIKKNELGFEDFDSKNNYPSRFVLE